MRKIVLTYVLTMVTLVAFYTPAHAKTINEADTELCDTFKYVLINSLREPIDQAINEIYKDDQDIPERLTWASYDTEVLKVKQLFGVGGAYEITLKVYPYYRAHIYYGEDIVVVGSDGELLDYTHIKTYPKVKFD